MMKLLSLSFENKDWTQFVKNLIVWRSEKETEMSV